jgi:hypothetical protein
LAPRALGAGRIEIHLQRLRRTCVIAVLTDDLLRILAHFGKGRALRGLGITGQANHQRLQRSLGGAGSFVRRLPADRLAHLIKIVHRLGQGREAQEGQTAREQTVFQAHRKFPNDAYK